MNPLLTLPRDLSESFAICGARLTLGDEMLWELAQEMDDEYIQELSLRHPKQIGPVLNSHLESLQ